MSKSSNTSGQSATPETEARFPPSSRSAFSEPHSTTAKESQSALPEIGRLRRRLHALKVAVAGIENEFARLLEVYNLLPAAILKDSHIDPEDIDLCRKEFTAGSGFFQVVSGNGRAIEAYRLRLQASEIQTLLVAHRSTDAANAFALAERDVSVHHMRLAELGLAIASLSLTAQHIRQIARLRQLQCTIFNLEDTFRQLKARYHTLSASSYAPSQSEIEFHNLVFLEETFGESPVKRSGVEAEMIRLQALVREAETAINLFRAEGAEHRLLDSSKIVQTVNTHLAELENLVARHEAKEKMKAWISWLEFCRPRSHGQLKSDWMKNAGQGEMSRENERDEEGDESGEDNSWHSCLEDQGPGSERASTGSDNVTSEAKEE